MSTMRPRVGAFGVGRMGKVHVETLLRLDRDGIIEFVALGDGHHPTLSSALVLLEEGGHSAAAHRISTFSSADSMAASGLVDAAVIASSTADHAGDALAFARRGIAVMLEKPMAGSIDEAARFCRELGDPDRRLVQIGFQRHYDAATCLAATWVREGRIGALQQSHHVIQDKNPTPAGYQSAGITADMAIHLVYEAMSFHEFTLPRRVQALRFLAPHYEDRAAEGANIVHVFCTWPDGSVAHLAGSRINATGYDNRVSLVGTGGRADIGDFTGDFGTVTAKLWCGTGRDSEPRGRLVESREFAMTTPAPRHPDFFPRFADAYANEVKTFAVNVARGLPLEPGPDVGWKTLLVANLAEASSTQEGRCFDLRLPDGREIQRPEDAASFAAAVGAR